MSAKPFVSCTEWGIGDRACVTLLLYSLLEKIGYLLASLTLPDARTTHSKLHRKRERSETYARDATADLAAKSAT